MPGARDGINSLHTRQQDVHNDDDYVLIMILWKSAERRDYKTDNIFRQISLLI
jgi:hypothetical protein